MKKIISMLVVLVLIGTIFAGCGTKTQAPPETTPAESTEGETAPEATPEDTPETDATTKEKYVVGIVQIVEHPSLDEIREAFMSKTTEKATEMGIEVEFDYSNAQNDPSLVNTICRGFVDKKVDAIVAIATPSAQGAATATTEIPIIFSAVTDPVAAGLVSDLNAPDGNITGVSDAIDVKEIFALAEELTPDVKSYGLIYNKGEVNSVSVIEDVKAYLDEKGVAYTEKTVGNSGEVQQAARVLLEQNDAIFAPIDNTVASAMPVLSSEAITAGKPVYVAADSMVADGGLATAGINYTELGQITAEMTIKALTGTPISEMPVAVMSEVMPVVNEETAKALGVDVSKYVMLKAN